MLKYPEGTACAEVLKAAASREGDRKITTRSRRRETASGGKTIFTGFGIGFLYQTAMGAFKAWKDARESFRRALQGRLDRASRSSPALLGVGYIIGPRIASIMCARRRARLSRAHSGDQIFRRTRDRRRLAPGTMPISEMGPDDIRGAYVLYIGAGAVAAGGIISLFRSLPTIWHGLQRGLARSAREQGMPSGETPRTDQDLSMKWVIIGVPRDRCSSIMIAPQLHLQWNLLGALLIVVFGFLFVTVSSRLTGEIGSSSNPISGMTVATLLLTCLVFLIVGWTGPNYFVTALSIGGIVCIASSNGGTTSQDLKTGFLVGADPALAADRHPRSALSASALVARADPSRTERRLRLFMCPPPPSRSSKPRATAPRPGGEPPAL